MLLDAFFVLHGIALNAMFTKQSTRCFKRAVYFFDNCRMKKSTENHPTFDRLMACAMARTKDSRDEITSISGLAQALGASIATVTNWARRGVSQPGAIAAELKFGCPASHVLHGAPMEASVAAEGQSVVAGPLIRGDVPLISSVQAGNYVDYVDNFHPGDGGMEMIPTSVPVGRHTFALRVVGDSMETEFTAGQILIIEPELDAYPGDFVIAKLDGTDETTFKQLVKDGKDLYLKPLNPRYPIKPLDGATIIGVLRAVEKRYR